jgi:hypothetical protein
MMFLTYGGNMTIQDCGDGDWEDPARSLRSDSLERAVEILTAHAPDAGTLTPEQIAQGTVTVAKSFENYLSGNEFLPVEPAPDGSLY